MKYKENLIYDVRVVGKLLEQGVITEKEYKEYLDNLPDEDSKEDSKNKEK